MRRIRAIAAAVILTGSALLLTPAPAHSTYQPLPDLLPKHCCAGDVNGDGTPEFECCTRNPAGCTASPAGCTINQT